MWDNSNYAVFDARERLIESVLRNLMTFGLLLLCIYVSRGSSWWTFFTGVWFIGVSTVKISAIISKHLNRFKSKAELLKWVQDLPDDN